MLTILNRLLGRAPERDTAPADDGGYYICRVAHGDAFADYVTLLPPEVCLSKGLPGEAVIGILAEPLQPGQHWFDPSAVRVNPGFAEFLHGFLAEHIPIDPLFVAEARRIGDGWVYVIDQRTPTPDGDVPPEDILGAVAVKGGKPVPGSYLRSEKHQLFTTNGRFRLGRELEQTFLRALTTKAGANPL